MSIYNPLQSSIINFVPEHFILFTYIFHVEQKRQTMSHLFRDLMDMEKKQVYHVKILF
jgi:hypothetical protein